MRPLMVNPEDRPLNVPQQRPVRTEMAAPLSTRIEPRVFAPGRTDATAARASAETRRRPPSRWVRYVVQFTFLAMFALPFSALGWWMERSGLIRSITDEGGITMAQIADAAHLAVEEVNVLGRSGTPTEMLLEAIAVRRGDPIMDVDLEAVRLRVEQLGWIKSAAVWRQLPGTLHIDIEEREPMARWQINGRMFLIDRDGKQLQEGDPSDFRHLIRIVGAGASERLGDLLDLLAQSPQLQSRVVNAVRVRGRRWDIDFDNGLTVKLPEEDPAEAWTRLADLERNHQVFKRDITVIDLRLPDRVVVKLGQEAQLPKRGGKNT